MSSVFDIRPTAVDISGKLSSYSSLSKSDLSGSAIKMPYTPTSAMSMSAIQIDDSGAAQAENYPGEKSGSLETGVVEREGGEETMRERGVMDMSVLPSPPLTRVGTNESRSTRAGGSGAGSGRVVDAEKEKDITAWRESMQRADDEGDMEAEEEEEEDVGVEGEELEDADGDGEFEGSEPRLREDGGSAALGPGKVPLRPLKVDIIPDTQSPPIWEIDGPTSTDDHHQEEVDLTSQRHRIEELGSKALSSKRLIPKSSYYFGPPPIDSAFGTEPIGQIGVHHPREVVRIERDYSGGELVQFVHVYPLEFEGRISATRFLESINAVNEILISAHSLRHSSIDNALAFFTLQLSRLVMTTHYEKEMRRLKQLVDKLNAETFNPVGLNMVWPRKVAFMFLEIEYY